MAQKVKGKAFDALVGGAEPEFGIKNEIGFIRSLNWYSNLKDFKDSKSYTISYLKEKNYDTKTINIISKIDESIFRNLGFVLRMVSRGYQPTIDQILWIDSRISELVNYKPTKKPTSNIVPEAKIKPASNDKVYNETTPLIDHIESRIDNRDYSINVYEYLVTKECKATHAKQIIEHFTPLIEEIKESMVTKDQQLIEAYSHYKKAELKKFHNFMELVIVDCNKLITNTKVTRKKKAIVPSKKVNKLNFKKEDTEYKIVSVNPEKIIGCNQLWVFNTKTRKLGVYIASDESGLSVKGSTIENFNTTLSISKTVRKPLELLPEVIKGKKTTLKKVMASINSTESELTGRINSDVVLLNVI